MGIQINGSTDRITAIDGTIDFVSNIGNIGLITASRYELLDSLTIGAGSTVIKTVNGKLGIGTNNPDYTLDVRSASGDTWVSARGGTNQGFQVRKSDNTLRGYAGNGAGVNLGADDFALSAPAGNLSLCTGGTAASNERLRIDSSGRLLVGHNASRNVGNVTSQMQLEGIDSAAGISITRNSNNAHAPYVSFAKSRAGAVGGNTIIQNGDKLGEIRFSGADGTDITNNAASIIGVIDGTPGGNDTPGSLTFNTTADGAVASTERARITSAGNFLVGKNSVYGSGKAQVHNTSQFCLDVATWAADATGPTIDFYKSRNATPGSATIVQNNDVVGRLRFLGNDGANSRTAAQITAEVDGTPGTNDMPGRLVFSTVPDNSTTVTERLRIASNGRVGITSTIPQTTLDVQGGEIYYHSGTNNNLGIKLTYSNGNSTGIIDTYGNHPLEVRVNNSERLRIDSSGRILKGIQTARGNYGNNASGVEYGVQIEGTSAIAAGLSIVRNSNDANDGGIVLGKTRATSNGGNTVVQAGDDLGNLTFAGNDGSTMLFGAEIFAEVQSGVGNDDMPADLIFKTNGGSTSTTERLRIQADGGVAIGTTTVSAGDLASGTTIGSPKLHVDCGHLGNGAYHVARFRGGSDNNNNAAVVSINHSNDRGLAIYGGRSTGDRSWIALRSIDSGGRVSNAIEIIGDEGRGVQDLKFYTGDSTTTTERLRITSGGNVAIGTITASNANLTVYGDGTNTNKPATIYQNALSGGGSNNGFYVGINHNDKVGYVWNYESSKLSFATSDVERLVIESTGVIRSPNGVQSGGNSSSGFAFDAVSTSCVLGVQGKSASNGGSSGNAVFQGWFGSSNTFRVNCDGALTCLSSTETSDIASKTDIEPITNVLDKMQQITGYTYKFKVNGSDSMGVIAQDVEKVFPELVHGEEGTKSLQYSGLIGVLIESVKELSAKVNNLQQQLSDK